MQSYQLGQRFTTAGLPLNGGKAYFYITGTTTLQTVFSDDGLTTPLANPVVADSAGFFPELVYLTPTVEYRMVLKTSAGVTISDTDPINTPSSSGGIDGADITTETIPGTAFVPGAVEDALGYTPANVVGDAFTGPVSVAGAVTVTTDKTTLAAGTTGHASLNIPDASADPTSPVNGDVWHEANTLKARLNGVTKDLLDISGMTIGTVDTTGDGYIKIGQFYEQFGTVSVTSAASGTGSDVAVSFPITFPTGALNVQLTNLQSSGGVASTNMVPYFNTLSAAGMSVGMDANGGNAIHTIHWRVLGF